MGPRRRLERRHTFLVVGVLHLVLLLLVPPRPVANGAFLGLLPERSASGGGEGGFVAEKPGRRHHRARRLVPIPPRVAPTPSSYPNAERGVSAMEASAKTAAGSFSESAVGPSLQRSVPNWRVLRLPPEDDGGGGGGGAPASAVAGVLDQRSDWSKESYESALELHRRLVGCTDDYVRGHITSALRCLDHALRLYGENSVVCSFNGGKDAVVVLHLLLAAKAAQRANRLSGSDGHNNHYDQQPPPPLKRPRVVYFEHADEFPELLDFLHQTVEMCDLDMVAFEAGVKFPRGLRVLVEHNQPQPLAFVLGTRTGDPNAGQQGAFEPSSHYMPPFMRVNPILDWTYGHVWHFLRLFQLPYCSLYDRGYTSLGTTKDTVPCPALAVAGGNRDDDDQDSVHDDSTPKSFPKYWPAYMLRDWDQERAGRIANASKLPKATKAAVAGLPDDWSSSKLSRANSSSAGRLSALSEAPLTSSPLIAATTAAAELPPLDGHQVPRRNTATEPQPTPGDYSESCASYGDDPASQKTVGLLIIGDEILKGYTADTNTHAAASALRNHNVLLRRVVVVPDDPDDIVREIGRLQKEVDVIVTSGGVGPTHDDVTIKSVAAALNCDMLLHDGMAQLLRDKMNLQGGDADVALTDAQVKMATLPRYSKLRYLSDNPKEWPVLQCRNIFILPGVPEYFSAKIANVASYLSCQMERMAAYKVVLSADENSIVATLNRVVENHPNVSFGSYPFVSHPDYKTVITVEGRLLSRGTRSNSAVFERSSIDTSKQSMDKSVERALEELLDTLPEGSVLRVDNDDMLLYS